MVEVETRRRECDVVRGAEIYKLCVDSSVFREPALGIRSKPSIEVEIEAKSDEAAGNIETLRDRLMAVFPEFELGNVTKQTRGVEFASEYAGGFFATLYRKAKRRPFLAVVTGTVTLLGSIASIVAVL